MSAGCQGPDEEKWAQPQFKQDGMAVNLEILHFQDSTIFGSLWGCAPKDGRLTIWSFIPYREAHHLSNSEESIPMQPLISLYVCMYACIY